MWSILKYFFASLFNINELVHGMQTIFYLTALVNLFLNMSDASVIANCIFLEHHIFQKIFPDAELHMEIVS